MLNLKKTRKTISTTEYAISEIRVMYFGVSSWLSALAASDSFYSW